MAYGFIQTRKIDEIHCSPLTTQMLLFVLLIINELQSQSTKATCSHIATQNLQESKLNSC